MKKYFAYIVYLFLALLIMRPFFGDGFLFLLDMVWSPHIYLADYLRDGISASFPLILIFKFLAIFFSLELIQKMFLLFILFLIPSFMYYLARTNKIDKTLSFLSGFLYLFNPWVYERFLVGHYLILLGYAFFPFVVALFVRFLQKQDNKNFYYLLVALAIYPIFSIHFAYLAYLFLFFLGFLFLWKEKKFLLVKSFEFVKKIAFVILSIVVVNSFWLFSFWSESKVFSKISLNDFEAFKTSGDTALEAFWNVLSLYGFWSTSSFLPKDLFPYFWVLTVFFIVLSSVALYRLLKKRDLLAIALAFVFVPVVFLSVGYASSFTRPMIDFLFVFLPGFKGFRETDKFVSLIAFSYAFLVPLGLRAIVNLFGFYRKDFVAKVFNIVLIIIVLLLGFLSTFGMLSAFHGELATYNYPIGWSEVEKNINKDSQVLFFPWHGYPHVDFAGRKRFANPARVYFSAHKIIARNIDNVYLLETEQAEWDEYVFQLVHGFSDFDSSRQFLSKRGVDYIVLLKIDDFASYDFLKQSKTLETIFEDESIVLYKVNKNKKILSLSRFFY